MIGPLIAGALAVGVGLTVSIGVGVAAGVIVLVVRLLEDYFVIPRVLGEAVGLSPLVVLVSVAASALLFGEFAVLLAIPLPAVIATLFDASCAMIPRWSFSDRALPVAEREAKAPTLSHLPKIAAVEAQPTAEVEGPSVTAFRTSRVAPPADRLLLVVVSGPAPFLPQRTARP